MFKCPNCDEKTISNYSKLLIGPVRSVSCKKCNASISIPYISLFFTVIYFVMILLVTKLNMFWMNQISILISSCVVFIYLHYRFVPLIIKLDNNDDGYKKQKNKNMVISIGYFVVSVFVFLLFLTQTQYETRENIVKDMTEINTLLMELEILLVDEDILKNEPVKIIDYLESMKVEIAVIQYSNNNQYSLNNYIDSHLIEGLNLVIVQYKNNNTLTEEALEYLIRMVETSQRSSFLRQKDTYHMELNQFSKLKIPIEIHDYEDKMEDYFFEYKEISSK